MSQLPEQPETPQRTTLPPQRAYQGEVSGRMRLVLGLSLLLAVGAVVGLAMDWREEHQPPSASSSPPATSAQPESRPNAPQAPGNETPQEGPRNSPPADH